MSSLLTPILHEIQDGWLPYDLSFLFSNVAQENLKVSRLNKRTKNKDQKKKKKLYCTSSLDFAWRSYLQLSFAEVWTCVVDFAVAQVDGASGAVLMQLTQKLIILKWIRLLLL